MCVKEAVVVAAFSLCLTYLRSLDQEMTLFFFCPVLYLEKA